jgi:hypothetical protein
MEMEYIAVAMQDGQLTPPFTGPNSQRVVFSGVPLAAVRLAWAHGATPLVRGDEPLAALDAALGLPLYSAYARDRAALDSGDCVYILIRAWRTREDGAIEYAAWQAGEPTEVLQMTVANPPMVRGTRPIRCTGTAA